jgi:drug/metabolite transporter (DMT)-like permease
MNRFNEYLQLHLIVLLNSFTPIIVKFINVPAIEIVFLRTFIALVALFCIALYAKHRLGIDRRILVKLLFSGLLTAIYWFLIILATKFSNASVCLVGIATGSLWVTFINPLFTRTGVNFYQFLTGLCAVFGAYIIFSSDFQYGDGLLLAIVAAVFGAWLTILNGRLTQTYHHYVITLYQMVGAWLGTLVIMPVYASHYGWGATLVPPQLNDVFWIAVQAFLFSILLYSAVIKLMKKLTPFTVTLVNNLSPVYGIVAALIVFQEDELMNKYFYAGATVIFCSVLAFPLTRYLAAKIVIEDEQGTDPLPPNKPME